MTTDTPATSEANEASIQNEKDCSNVRVKTEELVEVKDEQILARKTEDHDQQMQDPEDDDSEDDDEYIPTEPLYDTANSFDFRKLCERFENVATSGSKKRKPSKWEKLDYLLPKKLIKTLDKGARRDPDTGEMRYQSIYPILRLMCPDKDRSRQLYGMKDTNIAKTWSGAMGLNPRGRDSKKLTGWNRPEDAGSAVGDLSNCVFEVVKRRFDGEGIKSKSITVGEINQWLDELSAIHNKNFGNNADSPRKKSTTERREDWVKRLFHRKLSPIEHKWIVRLLTKDMKLGVGPEPLIFYYHPDSERMWSEDKNLEKLCRKVADKEFMRIRRQNERAKRADIEATKRANHLPSGDHEAVLNNLIDPMLSKRTKGDEFLAQVVDRHTRFLDSREKDDPRRSSLAFKFPAVSCEIKMDGERLLAHMKDGIVKVHTRNGKWYSRLYSPILGPYMREAVGNYNVDIILDGEVISWDNLKEKTIPFGLNRGICNLRQKYLRENGELDPRDCSLHTDEAGSDIVTETTVTIDQKNKKAMEEYSQRPNGGSTVWLKFVVFDVLYIGGKDKDRLLNDSFKNLPEEHIPNVNGSILQLCLMKRRRILQTLITPKVNMIEIVETYVVNCLGNKIRGDEYFALQKRDNMMNQHWVRDSIILTDDGVLEDFVTYDRERRNSKSDKEINERRASSINQIYEDIVTKRQLEGLLFKDLSSPYCFGKNYRNLGYWRKYKPDYMKVDDIDVVIIGGSYSEGYRNKGLLTSFVVAVVDDEGDLDKGTTYMTVGAVNGNQFGDEKLKKWLTSTGFVFNGDTVEYGSWYSSSDIPSFISQRTFQKDFYRVSHEGWKPPKKDRPELWINPEDSVVLSTYSGELVPSDSFSAGIAMRFPRISAVRKDGFDGNEKRPSEVDTVSTLHGIFTRKKEQQEEAESESQQNQTTVDEQRIFLTPEQTSEEVVKKRNKNRAKSQIQTVRAPQISSNVRIESDIFENKNFAVLDGSYDLRNDPLDLQDSQKSGWFDKAGSVRSQQEVVDFIRMHGGTCHIIPNQETDYILGGTLNDPRVRSFQKSIESITVERLSKNTKKDQYLRKIHELGGVLKWSFIYSICHRLIRGDIQQIRPRRNDYLVLSKAAESTLFKDEDEFGLHMFEPTNMVDFKRALLEADRISASDCTQEKRQKLGDVETKMENLLTEGEMAYLKTPLQRILEDKNVPNKKVCLYPDLYPLGSEPDLDTEEYSVVASCVCLANAIGMKVVSTLDQDVTHILCDLQDNVNEMIVWDPSFQVSTFRDAIRGENIHKQLLSLFSTWGDSFRVVLISTAVFRDEWGKNVVS